MNPSPWLQPEVIVSIVTLLTAIVGFATIVIKQDKQHSLMNSRMDQLLLEKGRSSEARGNIKGRVQARATDAKTLKKERADVALEGPKEIEAAIIGKVAETGGKPKAIKGKIKGKISSAKKPE